jgi:hypothetical protein
MTLDSPNPLTASFASLSFTAAVVKLITLIPTTVLFFLVMMFAAPHVKGFIRYTPGFAIFILVYQILTALYHLGLGTHFLTPRPLTRPSSFTYALSAIDMFITALVVLAGFFAFIQSLSDGQLILILLCTLFLTSSGLSLWIALTQLRTLNQLKQAVASKTDSTK